MIHDKLGDRMKENYEDAYRIKLPRRMPLIIRVDGKAFHTLTKGMERPWDEGLSQAMLMTARYLAENVQNCKLAYVQSDEISLLLVDYDRFGTEAWFDRNLQKMVSVSAAMATLAFNQEISKAYLGTQGVFDSRAFVVPREEVCNYFVWRQNDATRNSVQMLARAHFSHKSLNGLNNNQVQEKLFQEKGINWNDTPTRHKRGACIKKRYYEGVELLPDGNTQYVPSSFSFEPDTEIPIFSQQRSYIEDLLVQEEV